MKKRHSFNLLKVHITLIRIGLMTKKNNSEARNYRWVCIPKFLFLPKRLLSDLPRTNLIRIRHSYLNLFLIIASIFIHISGINNFECLLPLTQFPFRVLVIDRDSKSEFSRTSRTLLNSSGTKYNFSSVFARDCLGLSQPALFTRTNLKSTKLQIKPKEKIFSKCQCTKKCQCKKKSQFQS